MLTPMSCCRVYNYRLFSENEKKKNKGPGGERFCDEVHDSWVADKWTELERSLSLVVSSKMQRSVIRESEKRESGR